jgi:hypothetical protein
MRHRAQGVVLLRDMRHGLGEQVEVQVTFDLHAHADLVAGQVRKHHLVHPDDALHHRQRHPMWQVEADSASKINNRASHTRTAVGAKTSSVRTC